MRTSTILKLCNGFRAAKISTEIPTHEEWFTGRGSVGIGEGVQCNVHLAVRSSIFYQHIWWCLWAEHIRPGCRCSGAHMRSEPKTITLASQVAERAFWAKNKVALRSGKKRSWGGQSCTPSKNVVRDRSRTNDHEPLKQTTLSASKIFNSPIYCVWTTIRRTQ